MQIDWTLGDAMRLPPGLRPQRGLYLPALCIEAKLAQVNMSRTNDQLRCYMTQVVEQYGCSEGEAMNTLQ
eukprot:1941842-Pleurochrysis_carterae.AAC.1